MILVKQIGWSTLLFFNIFKLKKALSITSNKLNYEVDLS